MDFKNNLNEFYESENAQNFEQFDLKISKYKKIKKEAVLGEQRLPAIFTALRETENRVKVAQSDLKPKETGI